MDTVCVIIYFCSACFLLSILLSLNQKFICKQRVKIFIRSGAFIIFFSNLLIQLLKMSGEISDAEETTDPSSSSEEEDENAKV